MSPVEPIYIAGRFRTASRPSSTVIESALYSVFFALANCYNLKKTAVKTSLPLLRNCDKRLSKIRRRKTRKIDRICGDFATLSGY